MDALLQVVYLGIAGLLLLVNAFFVLAEFAIVRVRDTRMQQLARGGNRNAALAHAMLGKLDAYLSACQLGITIASLGLGWVGEPATTKLIGPVLHWIGITSERMVHGISVAVGFTIITALHIIIGELAPKSLAIRRAEGAALFAARPLHWFYLACYGPLWVMNALSMAVLRVLGVHVSETERAYSEEEFKMMMGAAHERGQFTLSRLLMMENVLDFGTLRVKDVMVPWGRVVTLDPIAPWIENLEKIRTHLHSRYPLGTQSRPDRMVHIKDLALAMVQSGAAPPDLLKIARPLQTVKAHHSLETLLLHFNQSHSHLALVEDEGGRLVGLVSIEDVVEELVGTIRDEFEKAPDYSLASLVPPDAILLDLPATGKEQAMRTVVERMAKVHSEIPVESAVAEIMRRESLASTGLGEGIAIPHVRLEALSRPLAAFARASAGLEFNALDRRPVDLVFLVMTPTRQEGAHVLILERIASLLSSDYLRERLRLAKSSQEVLEIFRISDKSLPA